MTHSKVSPSALYRVLNCPPSTLYDQLITETDGNAAANEGSLAHMIAERKLNRELGREAPEWSCEDAEMDILTDRYVQYCLDRYDLELQEDPDAEIFVEKSLDLSPWIPRGHGTADCLILSNRHVIIIDLKYGAGVKVDVRQNPQLMAYALGASLLKKPPKVELHVYQPRMENVQKSKGSMTGLIKWGESVLKPKAALGWLSEGERVTGEHCRFCKGKGICPKRAEETLEILNEVTAGTMAEILELMPKAKSRIREAEDGARKLMESGTQIDGWKLIPGAKKSQIKDKDEFVKRLKSMGITPYRSNETITITQAKRILGKRQFDDKLGDLLETTEGRKRIVPDGVKEDFEILDKI